MLEEVTDEIDIIDHALRYDNDALHVFGPEENRLTQRELELLEKECRLHTAL